MNDRTLTLTLILLITLAILWTNGKLQAVLNAAYGAK